MASPLHKQILWGNHEFHLPQQRSSSYPHWGRARRGQVRPETNQPEVDNRVLFPPHPLHAPTRFMLTEARVGLYFHSDLEVKSQPSHSPLGWERWWLWKELGLLTPLQGNETPRTPGRPDTPLPQQQGAYALIPGPMSVGTCCRARAPASTWQQ